MDISMLDVAMGAGLLILIVLIVMRKKTR